MNRKENIKRSERCLVHCELPIRREAFDGDCYRITVKGLQGGHLEEQIDKSHMNALILLMRLLFKTQTRQDQIRIVSLEAGQDPWDIPDTAEAVIVHAGPRTVEYFTEYMRQIFVGECIACEPGLTVTAEKTEPAMLPMDRESSRAALSILLLSPNGEQALTSDSAREELIYSNPGLVHTGEEKLNAVYSVCGTVPSQKRLARARTRMLFQIFGGTATFEDL